MARVEEVLDTSLGPTKLTAFVCEHCGVKSVREVTYIPNPGWFALTKRKTAASSSITPVLEQQDFCSIECLLRMFIPDAFDPDSPLSQEVVLRLQSIVSELG